MINIITVIYMILFTCANPAMIYRATVKKTVAR